MSFPPCLMPDAVQEELAQYLAFLAPHRDGAGLRRMPVLPVVAVGSHFAPSVLFKQLDDLPDFIPLHAFVFITMQR